MLGRRRGREAVWVIVGDAWFCVWLIWRELGEKLWRWRFKFCRGFVSLVCEAVSSSLSDYNRDYLRGKARDSAANTMDLINSNILGHLYAIASSSAQFIVGQNSNITVLILVIF